MKSWEATFGKLRASLSSSCILDFELSEREFGARWLMHTSTFYQVYIPSKIGHTGHTGFWAHWFSTYPFEVNTRHALSSHTRHKAKIISWLLRHSFIETATLGTVDAKDNCYDGDVVLPLRNQSSSSNL